VFAIDERLRGLPAGREQVVALFQSLNQPHLAIPGKQAGPAQGFIVCIRGANGFAVFVYLYLPESVDCAVYSTGRRNLTVEEYEQEESDALAFLESMAFMVDNLNFRALPLERQEELIRTLPVFFKDPKLAPAPQGEKKRVEQNPRENLGRLLSSF
jgi:hypothetical protein